MSARRGGGPTPAAPPDAAVARFRAGVEALYDGRLPQAIGLAVSGGPDSMAMLLLTAEAFPDADLAVATVDHGLRSGSAEEARAVGRLSERLGLPHATLRLDPIPNRNLSAVARAERYRALEGWAAAQRRDGVWTAHHADDQLETMLMRLNRGSGVGGLSGVRLRRQAFARPLLTWRKRELEDLVAACGVDAVDDPSNRDARYDRARFRRALADADWLDPLGAAQSARLLEGAHNALAWAARDWFDRHATRDDDVTSFEPGDLPQELLVRVVAAAIALTPGYDGKLLPASAIAVLLDRLRLGVPLTLAGVRVHVRDGRYSFAAAPPRRVYPRRRAPR